MQLRQHNRLVMSGSGSITLPSPLKRGDGFEALASKLVCISSCSNLIGSSVLIFVVLTAEADKL
jgi:hypothetical protein